MYVWPNGKKRHCPLDYERAGSQRSFTEERDLSRGRVTTQRDHILSSIFTHLINVSLSSLVLMGVPEKSSGSTPILPTATPRLWYHVETVERLKGYPQVVWGDLGTENGHLRDFQCLLRSNYSQSIDSYLGCKHSQTKNRILVGISKKAVHWILDSPVDR